MSDSLSPVNSEALAAAIISRFHEIGIPNGPLTNGQSNTMETFVKVMCEEIVSQLTALSLR